MYNSAFGLKEAPFGLTPEPRFVYLSAQHRNALAGLTYGILSRKKFILLSGDIGTGKTTLIRTALRHLPESLINMSLITNPTLTAREVLEAMLSEFGLTDIPPGKVERLCALEELLKADLRDGRTTTLIIDEAHKLEYDALEEIRLLGNFDSLQIVLAGQNELVDLLEHDQLRAFKQRISLRLTLDQLSPQDVGLYIAHRWKTAGGALPAPFDREAVERIAQESRGIPRLINTLCDIALMEAFQDNRNVATVEDIVEASADLHVSVGNGTYRAGQASAPKREQIPSQPEPSVKPSQPPRPSIFTRIFRSGRAEDATTAVPANGSKSQANPNGFPVGTA
jgi:general secretion pathway protein A